MIVYNKDIYIVNDAVAIEENRMRTHVTTIQFMQRKVPLNLGNNF